MRILMLGWEFPPFIAGGLGTACFGLTRALRAQGHEIVFVLPKPVGDGHGAHVRLLGPDHLRPVVERVRTAAHAEGVRRQQITQRLVDAGIPMDESGVPTPGAEDAVQAALDGTEFIEIPSDILSPYPGMDADDQLRRLIAELRRSGGESPAAGELGGLHTGSATVLAKVMGDILETVEDMGRDGSSYGGDLFGEAQRYAKLVAALAHDQQFDVIHAHDWLAYPAGLALRHITGKPLVCHMHATEFDRSGEHVNQGVYDIERAGMHGCDRAIAVSQLTKSVLVHRYGVDPHKVDVVYNGVEQEAQPAAGARIEAKDKIVLLLGRITMQTGPEYFIAAAKRVLEKVEGVKFVVAGSGDMAMRMIDMAAGMGIGHKVLFTGFLRGRDVDRVFRMADCYVMPSVSEPFGIAPLEAIKNDVPVIISKQSGVSEVLSHALKVDFWDVDELANKIVAVLRHPPLSQTLREHGAFELRALTWDIAAEKTVRAYGRAIASHH